MPHRGAGHVARGDIGDELVSVRVAVALVNDVIRPPQTIFVCPGDVQGDKSYRTADVGTCQQHVHEKNPWVPRLDLNGPKDAGEDKPKRKNIDGEAKPQSGGREDTRDRKNGHLHEVVMGPAANSALAFIWNTEALKADSGNGAAYEWKRALIYDERVTHLGAEQGELRHVDILFPGDTFTINDVVTLLEALHKLRDHLRWILAVHVDERDEVALGIPQPAFYGSLVADVGA